jgi:hypothetical protein
MEKRMRLAEVDVHHRVSFTARNRALPSLIGRFQGPPTDLLHCIAKRFTAGALVLIVAR